MTTGLCILILAATALAIVTPNGFTGVPNTGGMQAIPTQAKAPGTFSNGKDILIGEPDNTFNEVPDVYGAREIDIPIGRYFHGNLNFYPTVNDPTKNTDAWGSDKDSAEDTACGIPANSYFISGVAIHPYFLKYAGLDRYCMQDVCVWFWKNDGSSDMLLKVTDICTPDSADGVPCLDPMDIKIDRTKAGIIMSNLKEPVPSGNQYSEKVWWIFTKCSADGLAQPAYVNNSNWFTEPYLPNNDQWVSYTATQQYINNQKAYPGRGWDTYPPALYNISRYAQPITDWDPTNPPSWSPIAGGKGSSLPHANCSWPLSAATTAAASPAWESLLAEETPRPQSESTAETTPYINPASSESAVSAWASATAATKTAPIEESSAMAATHITSPDSVTGSSTVLATLTVVPLQSLALSSYAPFFTTSISTLTNFVCPTSSTAQPLSTTTIFVCGTRTMN